MKINLTVFGYDVTIEVASAHAESKVKGILSEELRKINSTNSKVSKKISLIKVLRRPEVSKILIDGHFVPSDEICYGGTLSACVGLGWAKQWVEGHFTETELTNN